MVNEGSEVVNTFDGSRLVLGPEQGRGGEGVVYLAHELELPDVPVAVKWYHPHVDTPSQRDRLEKLVSSGPPNGRFLWPDAFVNDAADQGGLGYVMPFRPNDFVGFDRVIDNRTESMSFATLATVGRNLADSFHALHANGLCYRDIKDANVFARPSDGEVLICDNDNVSIDGGEQAGVRGSLYFMAPEVMRGDSNPSRDSDLFSLAVLLFYLFVHHHPLEGRRTLDSWDAEAQMDALAVNPLFIFDPNDASNAPDPDLQDRPLLWWPILPGYLQDLFTRTFTVGLREPWTRVAETVWRGSFDDLRASEVLCTCGMGNLRDPVVASQRCWSCSTVLPDLPTLNPARPHGHRPFQLNVGAVLTEVNCSRKPHADHSQTIAVVEGRDTEPEVRGLRNRSTQTWTFRDDQGGSSFEVLPGRALRVRTGTLDFGNGYSASLSVPD